ncbi:xanthine dehydrogenase family protein molybdopterin-binding subunit [Palleronia caenipelagi]|uniref:Xanthine dehydrogenase family protein molybdopterin-binding subunit n=1 Tax=Palleronia caenipelagi TaxID=2489174 RepID=A0A547Q2H6_9RHOB|nr:molybdopterin cofactor-binding domain-containing protein [Palleronia caenipelagi]TRD20587.1 xanthine dehydrogenase family protein molybdopterin-binding subunit [Palleronia caenipelagi]
MIETSAVSRRSFLTASGALITCRIFSLPALASGTGPAGSGAPGVATQRIEGLSKITGKKVFARDFQARDMDGWPNRQWHAQYLRALHADRPFERLDLSALPAEAQPARVVLGDELRETQAAMSLSFNRDLHVEERIEEEAIEAMTASRIGLMSVNLPRNILYDLIVQPNNRPDYLGQAVALLLFDSRASYLAARKALLFNDDSFQVYGAPVSSDGPPSPGEPFRPLTDYVKYHDEFSYAQNAKGYKDNAEKYREQIRETVARHPEFIIQNVDAAMQAVDPMFMEPESGLVWIDPASATMHLLMGTQSPDADIDNILSLYGTDDPPAPVRQINLTNCYLGGGFGGRDSSPFSLMLALAGGFADGNPVSLSYDRFEQFRVGLKRHAAEIDGHIAVAPDMKLQAIKMTLTFDGGGRRNLSPFVASLGALCAGGSYVTPMADISAEAIHTENISGGSQRGFGGPQAYFAIETALDELAITQNWDPVALRRANLIRKGDRTVVGGPITQSLRLSEMLDIAERHPLWADRAEIRKDHKEAGRTYGTGFAMSLQAYGTSGDGMVAAVRLERDGSLTVSSAAVDMGNGSATTLGVVIGPILGANAARVHMSDYTLAGQTGLGTKSKPKNWSNARWTPKTVGSSSACLTGLHQVHTAQQTATALLEGSILVAAAEIWGTGAVSPDDVVWDDGRVTRIDGTASPLDLPRLAEFIYRKGLPCGALGHAYFQNTWAEASYDTPGGTLRLQLDGLSFYLPDQSDPQFVERQDGNGPGWASRRYSRYVWAPCVNVVGLTVDEQSGAVQIENVLSVLNAGHLHVPELVSGQSQGGVAMAISYTLLEDMPPGMDGPADGTWNLHKYHVARAADIPLGGQYVRGGRAQELITLPPLPGTGRVGRGIAEAVMCSVPPAISNAIRDATGKRFSALPITPERIREEMRR